MANAHVNGIWLGFDVAGRGEDLVLLHGGSGRRQTFGPLRASLRGWRTWALDFRGHGQSAHTPGAYQLPQVADDVAAFVDQQLEGPAVVYGHSFGAHVGLVLAAGHPGLVRALAIGDAPVDPHRLYAHIIGDRQMTMRWQQLAASGMGPQAIARELEACPVKLSGRSRRWPGTCSAAGIHGSRRWAQRWRRTIQTFWWRLPSVFGTPTGCLILKTFCRGWHARFLCCKPTRPPVGCWGTLMSSCSGGLRLCLSRWSSCPVWGMASSCRRPRRSPRSLTSGCAHC